MNKKWILFLILAFAAGLGANALWTSSESGSTSNTKGKSSEPVDVSHATLYTQGDKPVSIFNTDDKRIRIVYFGFTHCPDVCPTSLAMLAGALNQLSDSAKAHLWPIFITLDPERDTPKLVSQYAQYFNPMIEGLSAPMNVTEAVAHKYGVIFHKTALPNSELKYTIDHSSYFYILKPDGTLITKVPHLQSPAPLVQAINTVVSQNQQGKTS
ncbi:SCO family protein [Vibrio sp. S4M6]|uniref:SCO family protein n=1 Tax=Vibrio sinus TaxID=2946865 RepID=UPI002029CCDC|nr:SCO family protein [Vibrio sinus]MCL9781768.1 SCO family protein [Vibrio sinus]